MRPLNQMLNPSKSKFQLFQSQIRQSRIRLVKLSNLVDSDVPSQSSYLSN